MYKDLKKVYKNKILEAKLNCWKELCSLQNSKNPWDIVYKLCRRPNNFNRTLTTIRTDQGYTNTAQETATIFAHQFFPDDGEDSDENKLVRYDSQVPPNTEDDIPFTLEEVEHIIMKQNYKKSPGLDGISANIIKNIHHCSPFLFLNIFNKCLEFSTFPDIWKIASVKIIPKLHCNDKSNIKSYRPISLLPVIEKILEKLIIDRVMYHLYKHNCLNDNQYGFTPNKSTECALLAVMQWIDNVYKMKAISILVSLDISGAFDNVWWPKILYQLKTKKCPRNLYMLIQNYFTTRKAQIRIGNSTFTKNITRGCPQGSTCSPGFWIILYDDMLDQDLPEGCKVIAYADDAILLVHADTISSLTNRTNSALDILYSWGSKNKPSKDYCYDRDKETQNRTTIDSNEQ